MPATELTTMTIVSQMLGTVSAKNSRPSDDPNTAR